MTVIAFVLALAVGVASGIVGARLAFMSKTPTPKPPDDDGNEDCQITVNTKKLRVRVTNNGLVAVSFREDDCELFRAELLPDSAAAFVALLSAATNSALGAAGDPRRVGIVHGRGDANGVTVDLASARFHLLDTRYVDAERKPMPTNKPPVDPKTIN